MLLRLAIGACCLVFALTSVAIMLIVLDNDNAVRVRYALISEPGTEEDLDRSPGKGLAGFVAEDAQVPNELADAVRKLALDREDSSYRRALLLAEHIASGPGPGKGELDIDIVSTYRTVISDRFGDCTDYARLYAGLGYAAGLDARIWTTSFEGFGSVGHVFSEVYSDEFGWLFLDAINSFVVLDAQTQRPLSVLEFRNRLIHPEDGDIRIEPISEERFGFDSGEQAIEYYRRGVDRFALRMANDVLSYDELPWVRMLRPNFKSVEQGLSIALGKYPQLMILETRSNREELQSLRDLRTRVSGLLLGWSASGAAVMFFAVTWLVRRYRGSGRELT